MSKTKLQSSDASFVSIKKAWMECGKKDMTFVDLFCGAGGLSCGFEMAGLEGICGLDWYDDAGDTYKRNFNHEFVNGDITKQETKDLFYSTVSKNLNGRKLDIVAGGFPCQGFSMSGLRNKDDKRNKLYLELIDIVKNLQPEFVVCENVVGICSMDDGHVVEGIIQDFRDIGYEMTYSVLNAADFFTPQKRRRIIFIGNRIGAKNFHPKAILDQVEYRTIRDAISDLVTKPEDPSFNHTMARHSEKMSKRMGELKYGESVYPKYKESYRRNDWNQPSPTVKENHGGSQVHPKLPRSMTARELARLQSFPDSFIFSGKPSSQIVQIGNAVPPFLGKAIALAVVASRDHASDAESADGMIVDVRDGDVVEQIRLRDLSSESIVKIADGKSNDFLMKMIRDFASQKGGCRK